MTPYWYRSSGLAFMLAPTSQMTTGPWCDGKMAAIPGRRTPGRNILALNRAEATIAPVLPAETTALTSPEAIRPQHFEIELSRFLRSASTGFSCISTTWLAWTTGRRSSGASRGLGQLGLDAVAVADEDDRQVRLVADGLDGPGDDRAGGVVAPHRVQGDPHGAALRAEGDAGSGRITDVRPATIRFRRRRDAGRPGASAPTLRIPEADARSRRLHDRRAGTDEPVP